MGTPRKLAANFVETEVDDEILIVDLDGGELFSLKDSARAIWQLIDGKRSTDTIVSALAESFDAPPEVIAADVAALIKELASAALVSPA